MFRLPNTDPSRTNDRTTTPFSSPAAHTISHFYLSHSFFSAEKGGAPFAKDFLNLSHLHPSRLTSYPILRPRPDQPFLSEIFRRPRACTSLHLTPWSSPRPRKCAGQSRAHVRHFHSCHSSPIRLGVRRAKREISLSYSQASKLLGGKGCYSLFSSLTIGLQRAAKEKKIEKEISIE